MYQNNHWSDKKDNAFSKGFFNNKLPQKRNPEKNMPPEAIAKGGGKKSISARWQTIAVPFEFQREVADVISQEQYEIYQRNIENYIGTIKVPVGIAGPLIVSGSYARGAYYIPLATTEATLVASYNRGAKAITKSGGCSAKLIREGVSRAPGFIFNRLNNAIQFNHWVEKHAKTLKAIAEKTTRYGKLTDIIFNIEGNHVYIEFIFFTADAAGQNMTTIATEAVCRYILAHSPVKPAYWFIEANLSGDKKATRHSLQSVRGRNVIAEAIIPKNIVKEILHTSPDEIVRLSQLGTIGCMLNGTIGTQGHIANGLTALFLACGQDVACISESAAGITRFETTREGSLYASLTLPALMVGTVGGGTGLPSQRACLEIMGLYGTGKAQTFAEVAAGLCLAGELSIGAAISAQEFTRAHQIYARGVTKCKNHSKGRNS